MIKFFLTILFLLVLFPFFGCRANKTMGGYATVHQEAKLLALYISEHVQVNGEMPESIEIFSEYEPRINSDNWVYDRLGAGDTIVKSRKIYQMGKRRVRFRITSEFVVMIDNDD